MLGSLNHGIYLFPTSPQELIDYIVNELHDHCKSLKACKSFVAHSVPQLRPSFFDESR